MALGELGSESLAFFPAIHPIWRNIILVHEKNTSPKLSYLINWAATTTYFIKFSEILFGIIFKP